MRYHRGMRKGDITFVLFTLNEEKRIEYPLRCFSGYGDIMVIDNWSTDKTIEIAKKYTPLVFQRDKIPFTESEEGVDYVFARAKTNWFYWGYADELLPRPLVEKMAEISQQDAYKVTWVRRKNYNYGGVNLDNRTALRFFKKGAIDFSGNQIGRFGKIVVPPEQIFTFPKADAYSIHHFSTYDIVKFEQGHSRYSTEEARAYIRLGRHFSGLRLIGRPVYFFLRFMIVGGAWRWGWRGLIITAQYCFYFFNIEAKMWELEHGVTLESMERDYDKMKENLLEKYGNRNE
ncbi:MAG: Glycosyl transferase, family 2 [Microgenomates group bacterium GW2011_GWA1_48_10]|nr:MAG: Glycosyl transferase, family 2 [Microgenomates group bacterium GW2011_GWA1_48_10]